MLMMIRDGPCCEKARNPNSRIIDKAAISILIRASVSFEKGRLCLMSDCVTSDV